ncbi:cadherin-like domain-containing protein [Chroococcus sp. FPU101]|uniref:cadherin-like domain-containing protein n=1 Tax=Chroococcus sp. FPU101 TaxID=1974212 RepID=UPI001A8FB852|nr:cadherin-like domain-containing protein [Chroococcus sp. FPU101]GFE70123.1 hypothetical protein CFPU101_27330 [Chroococcus sp. FPU101]
MALTSSGLVLFDNKNLLTSYGINEDLQSTATIVNNQTLKITGNGWKKFEIPTYEVTANTILEFSYKSSAQGEIQGIGVDSDNDISSQQYFNLFGTENSGILNNNNYSTANPGSWRKYTISLGNYLRGNISYLTFINDQDITNPTAESWFNNIYLTERLTLNRDNFSILEDTPITIAASQLLSNDVGTSLRVTSVERPMNGTVTLVNDNIFFNPFANFFGNASFKYRATDRNGKTSTATVNIRVNAVNDAPTLVNDSFSTQQNTPVSLSYAQLLSNDSDVENNLLTVTAINQAVNGSIQINGTNITFTPNSNFNGQASFKYTVSDSRGGISTATANITVDASNTSNTSVKLGTNLSGLADYSTQLPFIDGFRTSRSWITQKTGVWNTNEGNLLNLDVNGYVKSLSTGGTTQYTSVGTLLYRELQGRYPSGRYLVLYDGEGTINYSFDALKDTTASTKGRDVINVTPSNAGIYLSITATDPNQTGNYLRNIRVIPEASESSYTQQIFNRAFLDKTSPYGAVRLMDWMQINNSTQSQWSNRPTLNKASWATSGAPVEVMVQLANQLDIDPWFCMPHQATNEYVTNFAQYVKNNLEPERQVYVEYSNEVWNWQFQQTSWVNQQALAAGLSHYADWYSKRTTEITRIWDSVWGTDKDRVIGVMATQAANVWLGQRELSYAWDTTGAKSNDYYGIDAIAIAPYFGNYLGDPNTANQVASWATQPDGGLNSLFDEITRGGILSTSPAGGALQQSFSWMSNYANLAQQKGLQLLAYEGGQHLVGYGGAENNQTLTNLFTAANRDPRMGEIYRQYLNKWYELGGGSFMNYSDIGNFTKWGSWGSLEYVGQNGSPKYDALMDVIQSLQGATN